MQSGWHRSFGIFTLVHMDQFSLHCCDSRWVMGKNGVVMVFNATFNNVSVILCRSVWKQDVNNKQKYSLWWLQIQENHRTYSFRKITYVKNTITTPFLPITQRLSQQCKLNWSIWTSVKIPKDLCHPLCICKL
jgi:hypothetical protein